MGIKNEIVVVTGSSGCLGQHIIKLLQERDENVSEIRLVDRVPYANKLGHEEKKPMKHFVGDIRDMEVVLDALDGADCVIHAAAVLDFSMFPDVEELNSININGTKNIIEGCIQKNVPRLIYSSATDVVNGSEHVFYGTESTTPLATSSWMIGKYGETKCIAESLVIKANGKMLANGQRAIRTLSVRPTPFYGEEDKNFFYKILQYTKKRGGFYRRIRSLDERLQITYVGNAAWAHLKAKDKLVIDDTIAGETFFITDETAIIDIHEHLQPYIESRGFKVSSYVFPYWLAWIILSLVCLFIRIANYFVDYQPDIVPVSVLNYMCSTFFYNRAKAILRLDYKPIYTPQDAAEKSMAYYSKVKL